MGWDLAWIPHAVRLVLYALAVFFPNLETACNCNDHPFLCLLRMYGNFAIRIGKSRVGMGGYRSVRRYRRACHGFFRESQFVCDLSVIYGDSLLWNAVSQSFSVENMGLGRLLFCRQPLFGVDLVERGVVGVVVCCNAVFGAV